MKGERLDVNGNPFSSAMMSRDEGILIPMNGTNRKDVKPGLRVDIMLKQDQRTERLTRGIVKDVLTKSSFHPHGIKVRLETGEVGRVKEIIEEG
jgi:uncharacterized repeat protein (TIGR03833 family)